MTKRAFRPVEQRAPSYPSWSSLARDAEAEPVTRCSRRAFFTRATGILGAGMLGAALLTMLGASAEASSSRRRPPAPPPKKKPKQGPKGKRKRKHPRKKPPVQFDGVAFMAPAPIDIER